MALRLYKVYKSLSVLEKILMIRLFLISQGKRIICFLLLFFALNCYAPLNVVAQKWEFGGLIGAQLYKGDLSTYPNPRFAKPTIAALLRYNISYAVVARAQLGIGLLGANGRYSNNQYIADLQPNNFRTFTANSDLLVEYNFMNYRNPKSRIKICPYLVTGIGLLYFMPKVNELPAAKVSNFQFNIPIGVGLKYRLNPEWNLGIEFLAHKMFTDYLDNVSKSGPTGMQQGYRDNKDWYSATSITLSYTFYTIECPFKSAVY